MDTSPEITTKGFVPVLSISPVVEDHCALQNILRRLQSLIDPNRTFIVHTCTTLAAALRTLSKSQFEVVVCERDLAPGSWEDVLDHAVILPDPPPLIVTSWLADAHLWAAVLNLGGFDVLVKPFDRTETMRVVDAAWRAFGGQQLAVRRRQKWKGATARPA